MVVVHDCFFHVAAHYLICVTSASIIVLLILNLIYCALSLKCFGGHIRCLPFSPPWFITMMGNDPEGGNDKDAALDIGSLEMRRQMHAAQVRDDFATMSRRGAASRRGAGSTEGAAAGRLAAEKDDAGAVVVCVM